MVFSVEFENIFYRTQSYMMSSYLTFDFRNDVNIPCVHTSYAHVQISGLYIITAYEGYNKGTEVIPFSMINGRLQEDQIIATQMNKLI